MHGSTRAEERRARIVSLTGVVIISVGLGFLGGRVSAWLVPIGGNSLSTSLGHVTAEPLGRRPFQSTEERKENKPAETAVRASSTTQAALEKRANEHDGTASAGEKSPDHAQGLETAERPEERRVFGATVVNAGSASPGRELREDRAAPGQERADTAERSTIECARRYASFRESDGTYQPFGSSQRRRCPL
ncbi:MAG: BA14K family protein [Hyphomicrobiaceae bacterium]